MFKKLLLSTLMLVAICGFQILDSQKVSAQDLWLYTDNSTGMRYYVVTETLVNNSSTNTTRIANFDGHIKYVKGNKLIATKKYSVSESEASSWYTVDNSEIRYIHQTAGAESEVALKLLQYCWEHFPMGENFFRM